MKEISMKYILCAALSLVLLGCGGGSPLTLTQDNLNKVQDDMSQADVRGILGAPTSSEDSPIPIVGGTQTTYHYQNDKSDVTIVFRTTRCNRRPVRSIPDRSAFLAAGVAGQTSALAENILNVEHVHQYQHDRHERSGKSKAGASEQ